MIVGRASNRNKLIASSQHTICLYDPATGVLNAYNYKDENARTCQNQFSFILKRHPEQDITGRNIDTELQNTPDSHSRSEDRQMAKHEFETQF